ncbi:MAG: Stage 0 sporulation A-like protein [Clostridium sp.]|jgi:two-component system, OmpR family, alkaline phosphatase synthesis response regulator PhoP
MICCIEDDTSIRELVVYTLKITGFSAAGFEDGKSFFQSLNEEIPELVLLDIMLPGEDGIRILKKLKQLDTTKDIPVILLTAKNSEYDKVLGLDSGADDYITKPFGMMELISRIRAVLRRTAPKSSSHMLAAGSVQMYIDKHLVLADGKKVSLTLKEFALLRCLLENSGIVLTRDTLLEKIWGYDFNGETRTVDVHIRTLRQKLGKSGSIIETIRGVGYRIGGNS